MKSEIEKMQVVKFVYKKKKTTKNRVVDVFPGQSIINEFSDEKDKFVPKTIRYVPGQESIYKDEQTSDNVDNIKFIGGILTVSAQRNPNLIDYLEKVIEHRGEDCPFYKYDRAQHHRKFLDKKVEVADAVGKIRNLTFNEQKAFLLMLTHKTGSVNSVNNMEPDVIKHKLVHLCHENPKAVFNNLDTTRSKNKFYLSYAITDGMIKFNKKLNSLQWNDGRGSFYNASAGSDPVDAFVDAAAAEDEHDKVLQNIKAKVISRIKESGGVIAPGINDNKEDDSQKMPKNKTPEELIVEEAIDLGVLVTKGISHYHFKGEPDNIIANGKKNLMEVLFEEEPSLSLRLFKEIKKERVEAHA